jgi:hypothetical protein
VPAIYLCDVVGTGTRRDAYRASVFDLAQGASVVLMIDDGPKRKAVVWSDDVTVSGSGITLVQSAPTKDALITKLAATTITAGQRNAVNNWLTDGGYDTLPANVTNQYDGVMFICRQVNPAVDLSVLVP